MIKKLTGALSLTLMATTAMAGGVERSNQSVAPLFADGNNITFSFGTVRPSVTGSIAAGTISAGNMADNYNQASFSAKMDVGENVSLALIGDQPYGANVNYSNTAPTYPLNGTTGKINSSAITALLKYQINENFSAYAGVRRQTIDASAGIPALGYSFTLSKGSGTGYVVGAAYEIPEIALRVSLTHNSEISSNHTSTEPGPTVVGQTVTSPKSWHLEAQSGIAQDTLLFGSIRWVNWSNFELRPPAYLAATTDPLLSYTHDSTTYTLGVGRKFNDTWSGSASIRYEAPQSGGGSNFGPTNGSTGLTIGAKYQGDGFSVSGGVNYTWIGDATVDVPTGPGAPPPTTPGTFANNHAIGAGVSVSIEF